MYIHIQRCDRNKVLFYCTLYIVPLSERENSLIMRISGIRRGMEDLREEIGTEACSVGKIVKRG